VNVHLLMSEY